jgi:hypothetical protein
MTISPDGLPSDADPFCYLKEWKEWLQRTFILGASGEASKRMNLAGAGTAPPKVLMVPLEVCRLTA